MPNCIKCNTYNNQGQIHCKKCQAILPVDSEVTCPKCASVNGPFAKRCRSCNYLLKSHAKTGTIENSKKKKKVASKHIDYYDGVDDFTVKTLEENYKLLAKELKVSPKVILYPKGTELKGFGGFFNGDSNSIELVDTYHLISALAHEMRHAYQFIHTPAQFYNMKVTNAYEYISCQIETDARRYAIDFCKRRNYLEEMNDLIEQEKQFTKFLNGILSAEEVGLDHRYFAENPIYPQEYSSSNGYSHSQAGFFQKMYWRIGSTIEGVLSVLLAIMKFASLGMMGISIILIIMQRI